MTYKYYPVIDFSSRRGVNESHWAAQAAECANLQGKFWEYHDKLFAMHSGENVGDYTKPKLKQYAADIQLDTAKFNSCLDTDQTLAVVQADIAEANRLGVSGTPTFFINNRQLQLQNLDFSTFARTIDSLLR